MNKLDLGLYFALVLVSICTTRLVTVVLKFNVPRCDLFVCFEFKDLLLCLFQPFSQSSLKDFRDYFKDLNEKNPFALKYQEINSK